MLEAAGFRRTWPTVLRRSANRAARAPGFWGPVLARRSSRKAEEQTPAFLLCSPRTLTTHLCTVKAFWQAFCPHLSQRVLRTMSFVTVGGDGSTRPTFFELVAAERLMPSLKAAATYSLSVRASSP